MDLGHERTEDKTRRNKIIIATPCHISYRTLIGAKPLRIRFDKIDGFTRVYNGTRYLVLFGLEIYDAVYNRIR